jgi:hypothetical protein
MATNQSHFNTKGGELTVEYEDLLLYYTLLHQNPNRTPDSSSAHDSVSELLPSFHNFLAYPLAALATIIILFGVIGLLAA